MPQYAVFTSYACLDAKANTRAFRKFVNEVRSEVQVKTGRPPDLISFVDGDSIKLGDEWEQVLAESVAQSEVAICLISPNYLNSLWCGRELEVFERRIEKWKQQAANAGRSARFVFPVIWERMPDRKLPATLSKYQHNENAFPQRYRDLGLRQLAKLGHYNAAFQQVIEILTSGIQETLDKHPRKLPLHAFTPDEFKQLPSAFSDISRPYDIIVAVLHDDGESWQPSPQLPKVARVVESVANAMQVLASCVAASDADLKKLSDDANDRRQLLICLAVRGDAASDRRLQLLDAYKVDAFGLLCVDSTMTLGGRPELDAKWAAPNVTGSVAKAIADGRAVATSADDLSLTLERLVTKVKLVAIRSDPVAKVEDSAIEIRAVADGIPTSQRPGLRGPGGAP